MGVCDNLIIKNARVIDPSQSIDRVADIVIENSKIKSICDNADCCGYAVIDAKGLTAAPGLVDMHVHLRDPGFTHKEDILTGCEAAAAGGVCSMVCMPNTKPVCDSAEVIGYIKDKAKNAKAKVYPAAAITGAMSGGKLNDFTELKKAGAVAVSDDGRPVESAKMMRDAIALAKESGISIISHCEDLGIIDGGIINEGEVSRMLGVKGMDRASEDTITSREMILAEILDAPIHIAHVSTKGSAELIRQAKQRGVKVTAETAPHYLMLTDEILLKRDADYRMNPPLRCEDDKLAMIEAVRDGTIDVIATDHAPHSAEEKSDFLKAPNGVIGMETSLSAALTSLVHTGVLTLSELIEKMSYNPASIVGIDAGTLKNGKAADIVLFDPDEEWTVDVDKLHGKSKNCVFKGMSLKGKVKMTLLDGQIVFDDRK